MVKSSAIRSTVKTKSERKEKTQLKARTMKYLELDKKKKRKSSRKSHKSQRSSRKPSPAKSTTPK